MLRTLGELHGPDGVIRLATMAGSPDDGAHLFVALSTGPVVQVQRMTREQVREAMELCEDWLFDTSAQGRPTVQRLNSPPAM
jgi:hypothetical protein